MLVTGGLVGLLALAGCGAAQTAQTAQDRPSVPGINVSEGGIYVRNAVLAYSPEGYPAGGEAPARLALVNTTEQEVRLVEAVTPAGREVTVVEAVARPAAPADVPAEEAEEPAAPAPAQPEPGQPPEVVLGPGGFVDVTLEIAGLTEELGLAANVPLQLTFDNQVSFALMLPVAPPMQAEPRDEPLDVGHGH